MGECFYFGFRLKQRKLQMDVVEAEIKKMQQKTVCTAIWALI
jgi:hypothetical protein